MARGTGGTTGRRSAGRWVRVRGAAAVALASVLALCAGAVLTAGQAGAAAPTPGWTAGQTLAPTGPDRPGLNPNATWSSVSCVSAVFCAGAGYYSGTSSDLPMLGVETNGIWKTQEAPLPSNAGANAPSRLSSVSCAAVGACVAVGFYEVAGQPVTEHAVVETLTGGTWSALDAPVPPDGLTSPRYDVNLQSVDCRTGGDCVAVGGYSGTGGQLGLIDSEHEGTWSAQPG